MSNDDDDVEPGPDPNNVRRHAKKMLTEQEYRRKFRRLDFYNPNKKQFEFHNLPPDVREAMLRSGNQQGKTQAGAAQLTFDLLGSYPDWHRGRHFLTPPAIERPFAFLAWCASPTAATTRDGIQSRLLGNVRDRDGLGTGLVPLDFIRSTSMARGIADFVNSATFSREIGGTAIVRFKTYEQSRQTFQGESVDEVLLDEDPRDLEIYGEVLARLVATNGRVLFCATPAYGPTPIYKRFAGRLPGTVMVEMCLADTTHIPPEHHAAIAAAYPENERECRVNGIPMAGQGAVFAFPEGEIVHNRRMESFPTIWPWIWGVDFSHAGMSASAHPFAAVLACYDPDSDVIYIVHAIRLRRMLAQEHARLILQHVCGDAPVCWPHDGNRGSGLETGETIAATYRKLGVRMLRDHAQFPNRGGNNFEAGIREMETRFATGRLRIAAHLTDVFEEYRAYHRVNGLVHKEDDDLLSAIRMICMDIRHAQILGPRGAGVPFDRDRDPRGPRYAKGTEQNQPFDLFTGRRYGT